MLTGKREVNESEQPQKKRHAELKRSQFESDNMGHFCLLYPTELTQSKYQKFLTTANENWEMFTTGNKYQKKKQEQMEKEAKIKEEQ